MKFNEARMSLIAATSPGNEDIPKAPVFADAASLAHQLGEYHQAMKYAQRGQLEARKEGAVLLELTCTIREAHAVVALGNLSYALELCESARQLLIAHGFQGSDRDVSVLDTTAEIAFHQGQYGKAYELRQSMVKQTSPGNSPRYYVHASLCLVEIEIILGYNESHTIQQQIADLKQTSELLHWQYGIMFANTMNAHLSMSLGSDGGREDQLRCFASAQKSNAVYIMFKCLDKLGDKQYDPSDLEGAFMWACTYFALARKSKNLWHTYQSLQQLADILAGWGEQDTALALFRVVLQGSVEMGVDHRQQQCRLRLEALGA
jgi:ATP/maltotriose-dependent transcriptional regulator MalT